MLAPKIRELLSTIRTTMKPSALALGGFSQGAMLSLDVALHEEESLSALLLFSGAYLSEDVWKPRFSQLKNVPIAQSHGTEDPILPFVQAEALAKDLTLAGASVTFTAFRGPHTIPAGALLRAGEVLKAAVDAIAT